MLPPRTEPPCDQAYLHAPKRLCECGRKTVWRCRECGERLCFYCERAHREEKICHMLSEGSLLTAQLPEDEPVEKKKKKKKVRVEQVEA